MAQFAVPHFEEEGRVHPKTATDKMPEQEYSTALDYLVFTCVDLALTHNQQVLLAKRRRYPRKSWWVIGGRMVAGEAPLQTARRKVAEEAGLTTIDQTRFQYIGTYSTCFTKREQPPSQNGSHSVNLTYQLELTTAEKVGLQLNEEYDVDWQWFDFNQVQQLLNPDLILDRALLKVIHDLTNHGAATVDPG